MKKRIAMLLYAAVLTLGLAIVPVMALADPFCPVEVETYTYGPFDELRINKVYQLLPTDDPSGIPAEDFELNGRRYYLLGMVVDDTDQEHRVSLGFGHLMLALPKTAVPRSFCLS